MTAALVRRMVPAHGHLATPLLVALFCTIWLTGSVGDGLRAVKLAVRLDERALARAAGRQILGPGALVGARISRFYTNGGDFSYMIEPDLLWNRSARSDLRSYFARFDAIAEDTFMSDATANASKASLSSWYADGTLSLRGFYFSQPNPPVSYLLLRPDPSAAIQGYGLAVVGGREKVLQFRQQSAGDYVFVAAVGPADETGRRQPPTSAVPLLFRVAYRLPAGESGERRETLTLVMRKEDYDRARPALAGYRIRDEVPLAMTLTTPDELLATLKNDEVIEFFLRLRDAAIARNQARRRRREPALRE